jgi:hypothetical protein
MTLRLRVVPGTLAICRLGAREAVPAWASGSLLSVTRTPDELSVVCDQGVVPEGVRAERGWRALAVEGPLDFALTGVLAGLAAPLAAAGISIFAISTFDTDWLLVRDHQLAAACEALRAAGHATEPSSLPQPPSAS